MKRTRSIGLSLAAAFAAVFGSCGGGGGDRGASAPATDSTLDLLVSSAAGADATVSAVLDGVVLERPDGSVTNNLLSASRAVTLAHPLAAPDSVALSAVPAGSYAAVHLLFRSGSGVVRGSDGVARAFAVGAAPLRAGIDDGPATVGAQRSCWQLEHRVGAPSGVGQGAAWSLDLGCSSSRGMAWDSVYVQVAAVDVGGETVDVVWRGAGNEIPVTLAFDENSVVQDDSGQLVSVQRFLTLVQPGMLLEVDGMFRPDYSLLVRQAKVEDRSPNGSGRGENKVLGRITATDSSVMELRVQVLEVVRGGAVSPLGALPELLVDASRAAIHRSGTSWVALPFQVLAVGDLVEVEWDGALGAGNSLTATEVELEDAANGRGLGWLEVEGAVGGLDLAARMLRMVPRRDDPIVFDGRTWPAALVEIDSSTLLYLDDPSQQIALSQVVVGQRVWVKGARATGAQGSAGEPVLRGQRVRVRN